MTQESKYTKEVYDAYIDFFPQGWIDNLDWSANNKRASFSTGRELIQKFELCLFINYAKLVLSADYFINDTANISLLNDATIVEDIVLDDSNDYKRQIQERFVLLCEEIRSFNIMLRYHINFTENRFKPHSKETIINALTDKFEGLSALFKLICDSCWADYEYSYNIAYIRQIIIYLEHLKHVSEKQPKDIKDILSATSEKLTILLGKLSLFSENKELSYRFDLQDFRIALNSQNQFDQTDFRSQLLKYIDVNQITQEEIHEWQEDVRNNEASLWKSLFLMRYYSKKTKSKQQIDNLIKDFERHINENSEIDMNLVDKYSCSLAKNYMYNSRFSFLCQCDTDYSFDNLKSDLDNIEAIQNDTLIYNYHPYQKAIEYLLEKLSKIVGNGGDTESANRYLDYLNYCFTKFKTNIGWCKYYQPYYIQSRYKYSTILLGPEKNIAVFCPSSFCRPLKFVELDEKIVQFNNEISFMNYQVKHLSERVEWQEAKDKVEKLERKNLETMGLFVTITTFLVGILSIFIGNNNVSIFTKIEYVSVLGLILLLFVCVGYFAISDKIKKSKPWIFGSMTVILLITIIIAYCKSIF